LVTVLSSEFATRKKCTVDSVRRSSKINLACVSAELQLRMIGPTLPAHLQVPRREDEDTGEIPLDDSSDEDGPIGPSIAGPQLPPHLQPGRDTERKRKRDEDDEDEGGPSLPKRSIASTIGPSMPPSTIPIPPPQPTDSDSDEEIGPSISSMMTAAESAEFDRKQAIQRLSRTTPPPTTKSTTKSEPKLQRDAWMLAPTSREDWVNTLDASKFKARTFNQSKSVHGNADHTLWTETPQERAQRVEDEKAGRRPKKSASAEEDEGREERMERDRRIKEYNERTRGASLMDRHNATKKPEEDDPSKRAFDWEKDIAGGTTLGFKDRNQMMERAKNLDSKFSGGHYL
jgi:hypothetical protein